ncbi:FAD binding domain-containing protein [Rhizobium leguminosarum]|uniref:FAD binding domain-containing protein n=1 Tax=Rhizobium leguminosarum TaxID=384 RepID=UPI0021BC26F5|nr:FAD binding domain-containing protein [Rhizobium leguminosarum]
MRGLNYSVAESAEGAIAPFAEARGAARYFAGRTSIYDLMKLAIERPAHLIDVSQIPDFDPIDTSGNVLRFGAGALMVDVVEAPLVRENYPILAESLLNAASQQLRNMGTVGGNLLQRIRCLYFGNGADSFTAVGVYPCNKREPGSGCFALEGLDRTQAVLGTSDACIAVATGDWPVALTAMSTTVEVFGPDGTRSIAIGDLYWLPKATLDQEFNLPTGELITAIVVPKASVYHKIRDRESYAFALASAAMMVDIDGSTVRFGQYRAGWCRHYALVRRRWLASHSPVTPPSKPIGCFR